MCYQVAKCVRFLGKNQPKIGIISKMKLEIGSSSNSKVIQGESLKNHNFIKL